MKSFLPCLAVLLAAGAATAAQLPSLQVTETSMQARTQVPVTVGQVFAKGDVKAGESLTATFKGVATPLQADVKARHDDGSVRHAVITAVLPQLAAGETAQLQLAPTPISSTLGGAQGFEVCAPLSKPWSS